MGGGAPLRARSRSRSGPGPQDSTEMYAVNLSANTHDQGYRAALPSNFSHALGMSPSIVHPVAGPIANPQSLAQRREQEQRTVLKLANAEIDELKDGLRYAELMLAKNLQEKEVAQAELRDRGQSLDVLSAKLRQRDEDSLRKDQMFRNLEQQLLQKDH